MFAVRYLWDVCNEGKCCVVTHHPADTRVAWLVHLACLRSHVLRANCNFESRLLYLGDAKIIIDYSRRCLLLPHEFSRYSFC